MKIDIVAYSNLKEPQNDMERVLQNLAGFSAGVCYSNGFTNETLYENVGAYEKNINRLERVLGTNHHSIADHPCVTLYISNISKALAMVLNSFEWYTTSERSARYTDFSKNVSGKEYELYNKWKDRFTYLIGDAYPQFTSKEKEKLAMENARYFISIFSKATYMVYTTSYRQWSYIAQWFDKFYEHSKVKAQTYFLKSLADEMKEFSMTLYALGIANEEIKDSKFRNIEFLYRQSNAKADLHSIKGGGVYRIGKTMSFACLAQEQRHRTLKYIMDFDDRKKLTQHDFYLPKLIRNSKGIAMDWLDDMLSVADTIPQGTLIYVWESGHIEDFALKCTERLCGRAQLETALSVKDTLDWLYDTYDPSIEFWFNEHGKVRTKCQYLGSCKEPCRFGALHALDRKV